MTYYPMSHPGAAEHVAEHRHLRVTCTGDAEHPGCGPGQMIIMAHERESDRLTGSTLFLVGRCGGCGRVIPSSAPKSEAPFSRWPRED